MSIDTVLVEKGKLTIIRCQYTHIQSCTLTIIWHKHNNKTTTHTMTQAHTHTHTMTQAHTHTHGIYKQRKEHASYLSIFISE